MNIAQIGASGDLAARRHDAQIVRAALEGEAARRLATRGLDEEAPVKSFADQARLAERDDYAGFFREDESFHERLASLAGVPNVWRLVHSVKGHVDRQRYRMMAGIPMRSSRAFRDHQAIVARICAGDADGAALAMRAHVNSVLELPPGDAAGCTQDGGD